MTELRRPKPAYQGRNGFTEPALASSSMSDASRLAEEIKRRRLAEWVIQEKASYFPSLEEMKRSNAEPETTSTIKRRIDELKMQHSKDMESLYAYYAQVYRQEQEDLRHSSDCAVSKDPDDPTSFAGSTALDEFYKSCRLPTTYQLEWDDAASRIRYSHLKTLMPLQKKLAMMFARFPESVDEYHAMSNNQDMQLKVARFLMAPGNMRDTMLSDFGWAWRQVKPLMDFFERDIDFRAEVQRYVKENEVRDPRKRPSMSKSM